MSHRPSNIDRFLVGRPDDRDSIESAARDPGVTGNELFALLKGIGCPTSRSAVLRWKRRLRSAPHEVLAPVRQQMIVAVMTMSEHELVRMANRLPRRLRLTAPRRGRESRSAFASALRAASILTGPKRGARPGARALIDSIQKPRC